MPLLVIQGDADQTLPIEKTGRRVGEFNNNRRFGRGRGWVARDPVDTLRPGQRGSAAVSRRERPGDRALNLSACGSRRRVAARAGHPPPGTETLRILGISELRVVTPRHECDHTSTRSWSRGPVSRRFVGGVKRVQESGEKTADVRRRGDDPSGAPVDVAHTAGKPCLNPSRMLRAWSASDLCAGCAGASTARCSPQKPSLMRVMRAPTTRRNRVEK